MMQRQTHLSPFFCLVAFIWLAPLNAGGQEMAGQTTPDSTEAMDFTLETVVVTATRDATNRHFSASRIRTLSSSLIQSRPGMSVTDALKTLPGVRLAAIEHGGFVSPGLRGFSATENLVLMDGVPVNNSLANLSPVLSLPALALGRIEVAHGAGSIIYGPNAPGGAINILSAPAPGDHKMGLHTHLGSFGTSRFQLQYGGSNGPTNYAVHLSRDYSDGYLPSADYSTWSLAGQSGWQVGQSRLRMTVTHVEGEIGVPQQSGIYERFDDWRNTRAGFAWQQPFSTTLVISSMVYFNREQNRYLIYKDATYAQLQNEFANTAMLYGGEVVGNVRITDQNILAVGVQARSDRAETPLFGQDREESVLSLFAQEVVALSPRLKFNVVARSDHHQKIGSAVNYLAGVVVQPLKGNTLMARGTHLRLSYGTAARFPSLRELYLTLPKVGMGNVNLKKETSSHFEMAVEMPLGRIAQFAAGYFNTRAQDMISRDFSLAPWHFTNLAEVKFYGFELEVSRDYSNPGLPRGFGRAGAPLQAGNDRAFDNLGPVIRYGGFARYSYLRAEEAAGGTLPMRPRNQVVAGIRGQINQFSGSLTAQGTGVQIYPVITGTSARLSLDRAGLEDYILVDLKLQYRLSRRIGLALSAENLTDETYFIENDHQFAPIVQGQPRRMMGALIIDY
jgi:outer membrane cobalamin receptor